MSTATVTGYAATQRRFRPLVKPMRETKKAIEFVEKKANEYVDADIDREKTLQSIEYLTKYMEDLKAGRPVENICEDDPWYLVPENLAMMIESDKALLKPNVIFREIDANNIWKCIK